MEREVGVERKLKSELRKLKKSEIVSVLVSRIILTRSTRIQ